MSISFSFEKFFVILTRVVAVNILKFWRKFVLYIIIKFLWLFTMYSNIFPYINAEILTSNGIYELAINQ
jgi:hypothetical protein